MFCVHKFRTDVTVSLCVIRCSAFSCDPARILSPPPTPTVTSHYPERLSVQVSTPEPGPPLIVCTSPRLRLFSPVQVLNGTDQFLRKVDTRSKNSMTPEYFGLWVKLSQWWVLSYQRLKKTKDTKFVFVVHVCESERRPIGWLSCNASACVVKMLRI